MAAHKALLAPSIYNIDQHYRVSNPFEMDEQRKTNNISQTKQKKQITAPFGGNASVSQAKTVYSIVSPVKTPELNASIKTNKKRASAS